MGRTVQVGERLRRMWDRLGGWPAGSWLFSRVLGLVVPYSGTIGATVVELGPGHARVCLRDRRRVRNHLRSIHAMALANLGELCTGLALNCGLSSSLRAILVSFTMQYRKKARGELMAECRCQPPRANEEREVELTAEIRDGADDVVAVASARWRVGPVPASSS